MVDNPVKSEKTIRRTAKVNAKQNDETVTLNVSKSTLTLVVGLLIGIGIGLTIGVFADGSSTGNVAGVPAGNGGGGSGNGGAPQAIAVDADDDAVLGNPNAPVTIIEFSDFQCPFCRSFWTQTLPQLKSNFIDTGKVKLIYRDFPLSFHPAAQPSAEAAECADDQGMFWQLHDKIFEEQSKQGSGTIQFTVDDIKSWAKDIPGLDYNAWEQCLDSGKYKQEVSNDLSDGSVAGVSGTPSFYVSSDGKTWTQIEGAQPYQVFERVINQLLQ